ncbi:alpha/beta hydrolase [Pseudonocardia sp.]|uniref:alpha/beta hydrolase n=1 Tax=Pseudonocardia sp. TaxID=60912 RepID=UPI003D148FD0
MNAVRGMTWWSDRLGRAVASAVGLALVTAACSGGPDRPDQEAAPGIAWTECGDGLQCATVPVPLDWADPAGEQISLAVIRRPASKPDQRIGTLLVNPGGPGDTGVGLVRTGADIEAWGGGRFDVISWDPRGTHGSSPVKCFTSDAEEAAFWNGAAAYAVRTQDLARRCGEVMGPLLSHISTADTVRDLDRLRELAGEGTITYVGLSYGTFVGQVYATMFPDRVRAMVLDGLIDAVAFTTSAETRSAVDSESTDAVFGRFLELCEQAGPGRCALAGHGETAAQRVARLFERARQGPIPAPDADPPGELVLSDLLVSSFSPLWAPCASNWPGRSEDRFTGSWNAGTAAPILLIGTRYDPNTGYRNAVRTEQLLGNAVLLTHDGYGHVSFQDPSACVEAAKTRYLVDLQAPAPGTVCPADRPPFS